MSYMNSSFTIKSAGAQASQAQLSYGAVSVPWIVVLQAGLPAQGLLSAVTDDLASYSHCDF